jgi:hypothetical protein
MPLSDPTWSWWAPLVALGGLALAAFLVAWVLTDVLHVPRVAYLSALMVVTAALAFGYLAWSGTDTSAFVVRHWGWGVLGAVLSGLVTARAIIAGADRRGLPRRAERDGRRLVALLVWEGLLYGVAEGVLLSALPVLAAWQSFSLLGWTGSTAGALGSGALAVLASAAVIFTHHLGYREFRRSRTILLPIVACGLLSVAYLLTRSSMAPTGGHFLTHAGAEVRGIGLPPYSQGLTERGEAPPQRAAA